MTVPRPPAPRRPVPRGHPPRWPVLARGARWGLLVAAGLLLAPVLATTDPAAIDLSPPLPADLPATASFGEYRTGHLHAGLDFSTRGELGWEVRAAADGEVYRLKVERRGYGRAVYIRHAGGFETVYGHLHDFEDATLGLERTVAAERARTGERYPGDIYLDPPRPVRRGQPIARSGEAGGGLPHLHFELRRDGEPVDPLRYGGLRPAGFAAPDLEHLWVVPRGPATVDGRWVAARYPLERSAEGYRLTAVPRVAGEFDLLLGARVRGAGHLGLGSLELDCGGGSWFQADLHRFSFEEFRQSGLLFDVSRSRSSPAIYTYRLRRGTGLSLPGTAGDWPREIPPGELPCRVIARAADGEAATAVFRLRVEPAPSYARNVPRLVKTWRLHGRLLLLNGLVGLDPLDLPEGAAGVPGIPAVARAGAEGAILRGPAGVEVRFPKAAFFADEVVGLAAEPDAAPPPAGLTPAGAPFRLEPEDLYLREEAVLRAPAADLQRAAFYWHDPVRGEWQCVGGTPRAGTLEAGTRGGGVFALFEDGVPPRIEGVHLRSERRLGARRLVFPVVEVGEGIEVDAFEATLGGEPAEAEYDPDRGWGQVWLRAGLHGQVPVTARCRDRAGNISEEFRASVKL